MVINLYLLVLNEKINLSEIHKFGNSSTLNKISLLNLIFEILDIYAKIIALLFFFIYIYIWIKQGNIPLFRGDKKTYSLVIIE